MRQVPRLYGTGRMTGGQANPNRDRDRWIPAFARMTEKESEDDREGAGMTEGRISQPIGRQADKQELLYSGRKFR